MSAKPNVKALHLLEKRRETNRSELADELGISLGAANYLMKKSAA